MKRSFMLTIASLLSILLSTFHLSVDIAKAPSGGFFFVWTIIALGVTALFSVILSARGLWSPQWGQSR